MMRVRLLMMAIFITISCVIRPQVASAAPLAVVNGVAATEGAHPWMVAILQASIADTYAAQFCGGTLIASEWVLTAAHCTFSEIQRPFRPGDLQVMVGQQQLSSVTGQRVQVDRIVRHRDFDMVTFQNDIALLHLAEPVAQLPMALADEQTSALETPAQAAMVVGWGVTEDGNGADTLRQARLPLVESAACRQQYAKTGLTVHDTMLCAGFESGAIDTCSGDSGGPLLVWNASRQQWTQIGIVSWGAGCATADSFGVYTRIASYTEWIAATIAAQ